MSLSSSSTSPDFGGLVYDRPADKIKTINIDPIRKEIKDSLEKYQRAALGYDVVTIERLPEDKKATEHAKDASSVTLEQITHFSMGTGRNITNFCSVQGDDWRGVWRAGGAVFAMDLDGSEKFQLWRYWEDTQSQHKLPLMESELDNKPGKGRIERITHDAFRYTAVTISNSNKIFAFASNKENGKDTHIYISRLVDSSTGFYANAEPFTIPSQLITPLSQGTGTPTWWNIASISPDDRHVLLVKMESSSHRPLYLVDISKNTPSDPELIVLPGATEKEQDIATGTAAWSLNPAQPNLVYLITDAYGDFASVVTYDISHRTVTHITTPEPHLDAICPIPWDAKNLKVSNEHIIFQANIEGWDELFVHPLHGPHEGQVIPIKIDHEGGNLDYITDAVNGKPWHVVVCIVSSKSARSLFALDLQATLQHVETDGDGKKFVCAALTPYRQAQAAVPTYRTLPPQLLRYKSFDGLDIPTMYYHPADRQKPVPLVISIHGGPASQAASQVRMPIHGYVLNELNCAIMYPNVRGSAGYGKRYMAADDVEKREDSVKDIGALLEHVRSNMRGEVVPDRIAVIGGSYGGYMTYACLVHFSSKLRCGVATCPVADWVAFLRNTAKFRQAHRRREYGDESDPKIQKFLEQISPLNHAEKITVPLLTAHGENDTRITVEEAIKMWDMVQRNGVHSELIVAEKEGHGFVQQCVIEYCNAARVAFLERWLVGLSHD